MKHVKWLLLAALLALPIPSIAAAAAGDEMSNQAMDERLREAERRMEEAARELADINLQLHSDDLRHVFKVVHDNDPNRAMLGINIGKIEQRLPDGTHATAGDASDGVTVLGVTPGGPAEEAGLQAGDVIVQLNGKRLAGHREAPHRRLQALMDEVRPGDTVSVSYRRGDAQRNAQIVTQAFEAHAWSFGDDADFDFEIVAPGDIDTMVGRMPFLSVLRQHREWQGLELVELNADLGRYFGTAKGLLVVRAPAEQRLGLQAGDVVQTIGGATPRSVPDAMRLLRYYQPGDKLVVEVMRDKRGKTLEMVVPEPEA